MCRAGDSRPVLNTVLNQHVSEGKNDINARVEYFGVGLNLRSERPSPDRIRRAADRVLSEPRWKPRAMALREELSRYNTYVLIDQYLESTAGASPSRSRDRSNLTTTPPCDKPVSF
jgi:hypothetical protein